MLRGLLNLPSFLYNQRLSKRSNILKKVSKPVSHLTSKFDALKVGPTISTYHLWHKILYSTLLFYHSWMIEPNGELQHLTKTDFLLLLAFFILEAYVRDSLELLIWCFGHLLASNVNNLTTYFSSGKSTAFQTASTDGAVKTMTSITESKNAISKFSEVRRTLRDSLCWCTTRYYL